MACLPQRFGLYLAKASENAVEIVGGFFRRLIVFDSFPCLADKPIVGPIGPYAAIFNTSDVILKDDVAFRHRPQFVKLGRKRESGTPCKPEPESHTVLLEDDGIDEIVDIPSGSDLGVPG
jgi:hypothetical protein